MKVAFIVDSAPKLSFLRSFSRGIAAAVSHEPSGAMSAKVATPGNGVSVVSARSRGAVNSADHHAPFGARLNSR